MKSLARFFLIACVFTSATFVLAQNSSTVAPRIPQNARQALLEMFFGKPGTLEKHLPEATRKALREAGQSGSLLLRQFSLIGMQLSSPESHMQTFEAGSTLLSFEEPRTLTKVEVTVEKDDLRGDEDDIELSFHLYKNGQPEKSPVLPVLTFSMKQEKGVWRLNEISATVRVGLADPELLKMLVKDAKASHAMTGPGAAAQPPVLP